MLKLVLLVTSISAILPTDGECYSSSGSFGHAYLCLLQLIARLLWLLVLSDCGRFPFKCGLVYPCIHVLLQLRTRVVLDPPTLDYFNEIV